jgi:hypothetical protein
VWDIGVITPTVPGARRSGNIAPDRSPRVGPGVGDSEPIESRRSRISSAGTTRSHVNSHLADRHQLDEAHVPFALEVRRAKSAISSSLIPRMTTTLSLIGDNPRGLGGGSPAIGLKSMLRRASL